MGRIRTAARAAGVNESALAVVSRDGRGDRCRKPFGG